MLCITLTQPEIKPARRQELVELFRFGSPDWGVLFDAELPTDLPPTGDLLLRALRRMNRKDYSELNATRREAFLLAPFRPLGIHEALLAEALAGEKAGQPLEEDADLALHVELLPQSVPDADKKSLADLRARGLVEGARRLITASDPRGLVLLQLADNRSKDGTGDKELAATLLEVLALLLEKHQQLGDAALQRSIAVEMLFGLPPADRLAEAMTDLADVYQLLQPGNMLSPMFYEDAAARLEALPPDFNLPLRRRLAVARRIC